MKATLQFKDYHVLETIYRFDPFFSSEAEFEDPNLFFRLDVKPETINEAAIALGIELGDREIKKTPYYVKATILGLFEIESEGLEEKQVLSLYKFNGVAILFPYLRSIVSDLSSKGSESPIIIPTINVAAMVKEADNSQNSKSNDD